MKEKKITDEELQAAIQKFVKAGGIIRKLPDQRTSSSQMVGMKWNNAEIGGDLIS
jgi:hypothetical protein